MTFSGCKTGDYDYCDVESVIEEKCVICHSDPPVESAPYSLASYEDVVTHQDSVREEIKSKGMPVVDAGVGSEALTKDERRMLLDWLKEGAPDCPPTTP
jgi:uncharacterized membrane protein